jgi:phosphomethylpyrimidine synthase
VNNPQVFIYDTSGPYTDPEKEIDVRKGIEPIRKSWILDRGDVEQLSAFSSEYSNERLEDKSLDGVRFEHIRLPLKAKAGANVSQMHYAKKGIITPEMEYIAIRENQNITSLLRFPPKIG